ncbi:MAG TPA: hypothetical protein VLV78_02465 [Thermoanaerobaculia bacterium]|nr:hypothetical protein [Thermoanaerobaculia bacterium]
MRRLIFVVALLAVCPAHATDWTRDLDALVSEIERVHPNPYTMVTRDEFHAAVSALRERAPTMKPYEVVAEIARIVGLVGDGHTRLTLPIDPNAGFFIGHSPTPLPADPALRVRHLPVRFFWFEDGVFIRDAAERKWIGAKVLRIGNDDIETAMRKMTPYVSADNDMQRRLNVADDLSMPEMIAAAGIAPTPERIDLVTDRGALALEPIAFGSPAPWLKRTDPEPFSFRYLARDRIVLFKYNEVSNGARETLAGFATKMFAFIDDHPVDALVIDIRENPGGNGALNRSLVHGLIRSRKLYDTGRVFVLTGRRTFSAAIFFLLDLEQQTNAIFVGEPTGGRPVHFGDSRKSTLPSSGLTVRISTLYWQKSDPRDKRDAVPPHIAVPLTSAALDRDVTLDTVVAIVRAMHRPGKLTGRWSGATSVGWERVPMEIENPQALVCGTSPPLSDAVVDRDHSRIGNGWAFGTCSMSGLTFPFFLRQRSTASPRVSVRPSTERSASSDSNAYRLNKG